METPENIQKLYRHWEYHTREPIWNHKNSVSPELKQVIAFANERMKIWQKKIRGENLPYTSDPILRDYRFCNIYRELDKQTIEIHKLLNPLRDNFVLWLLNLAFTRFLCNTETFKKVGLLDFDQEDNLKAYNALLNLPAPKYGSAYVFPISVIQRSKFNTREKFLTLYLPMIMTQVASEIQNLENSGVVEALEIVLPVFGFNFKFHWTEILIDVAYQFPEKINLFKRFHIGPGSIPTMKILSDENPEDTLMQLVSTKLDNFSYLEYKGKTVWLSAENWEGMGCEFRKYSNLKNGEGRKRLYK